MNRRSLDRRTVLRGLLRGTLLSLPLPPLDAMLDTHGLAYANGTTIPKRFGVFFWGNGVRLDQWVPKSTGPNWVASPALAGFAAMPQTKAYLSVISGMRVKHSGAGPHSTGLVGILSAAPHKATNVFDARGMQRVTFSVPSIDQVVAEAWKGQTRFPSVELGIAYSRTPAGASDMDHVSHRGPSMPNTCEFSAPGAFDRLFGGGRTAPTAGAMTVDQEQAMRTSVLDAVADDARALRSRLGVADRQKLDAYLEDISSLQKRLVSMDATAACEPGVRPGDPAQSQVTQRTAVMADILALALQCDLTRVFTVQYSTQQSVAKFTEAGISEALHTLTHLEPDPQPQVGKAVKFAMDRFAQLLDRLRRTPIGAGNLLDHCCILGTSEVSEGKSHAVDRYPIMVAGRAGGALRAGAHHSAPGDNATKVLLTLLRAVGLPLPSYGKGNMQTTEEFTPLRA